MAHPSDSLTPVDVGNLFGGLAAGTIAAFVAVRTHALTGGASVPARDLVILLGTVLVVGLLSGLDDEQRILMARENRIHRGVIRQAASTCG